MLGPRLPSNLIILDVVRRVFKLQPCTSHNLASGDWNLYICVGNFWLLFRFCFVCVFCVRSLVALGYREDLLLFLWHVVDDFPSTSVWFLSSAELSPRNLLHFVPLRQKPAHTWARCRHSPHGSSSLEFRRKQESPRESLFFTTSRTDLQMLWLYSASWFRNCALPSVCHGQFGCACLASTLWFCPIVKFLFFRLFRWYPRAAMFCSTCALSLPCYAQH